MQLTLSYGTKYRSDVSASDTVVMQTCRVYTGAVKFLFDVCSAEWYILKSLSQKDRQRRVEILVHRTKDNPCPEYDFDSAFPDFPSYLRRSAINLACGKMSAWMAQLQNWQDGGCHGKKPSRPCIKDENPCFYYRHAFKFTDKAGNDLAPGEISCYAKIKVFCSQRQLLQDKPYSPDVRKQVSSGELDPARFVWDWLPIKLKTSDIGYLKRRKAEGASLLSPLLVRKGSSFELRFAVKQQHELSAADIYHQTIISVDLGINTPAVCSVMLYDGTVLARRFYRPAGDTGCLSHRTALVSRAQSHGSKKTPVLWRMADNANRKLSDGTADFIIALALEFNADVIVFEHLDTKGRKRGAKKKKLHHWRAKYVQELVSDRAHRYGIRIARVCAWGTSKLAYDGSGYVKRGKESAKTNNNYSLCEFTTGKIYNCDLSASYNIGARYFIREILKTVPATVRSELMAKVPELMKRSTCTLASLIKLNAVLSPSGNRMPKATA